MSDESSDAFKIRSAPSGKFYVRGDSEAICLPNGNLRYFETERDVWVFLQIAAGPKCAGWRRNGTQMRSYAALSGTEKVENVSDVSQLTRNQKNPV
jgi:hypothetical protein